MWPVRGEVQNIAHAEARSAPWLVFVFFSYNDRLVIGYYAIRMRRQTATMHTYSMQFRDVFGYRQQVGHCPKRLATVIHIET